MEAAERKDFRKPHEVREGNEPAVVVDFQGMIDYARSR
jgi:hypothetical protein